MVAPENCRQEIRHRNKQKSSWSGVRFRQRKQRIYSESDHPTPSSLPPKVRRAASTSVIRPPTSSRKKRKGFLAAFKKRSGPRKKDQKQEHVQQEQDEICDDVLSKPSFGAMVERMERYLKITKTTDSDDGELSTSSSSDSNEQSSSSSPVFDAPEDLNKAPSQSSEHLPMQLADPDEAAVYEYILQDLMSAPASKSAGGKANMYSTTNLDEAAVRINILQELLSASLAKSVDDNKDNFYPAISPATTADLSVTTSACTSISAAGALEGLAKQLSGLEPALSECVELKLMSTDCHSAKADDAVPPSDHADQDHASVAEPSAFHSNSNSTMDGQGPQQIPAPAQNLSQKLANLEHYAVNEWGVVQRGHDEDPISGHADQDYASVAEHLEWLTDSRSVVSTMGQSVVSVDCSAITTCISNTTKKVKRTTPKEQSLIKENVSTSEVSRQDLGHPIMVANLPSAFGSLFDHFAKQVSTISPFVPTEHHNQQPYKKRDWTLDNHLDGAVAEAEVKATASGEKVPSDTSTTPAADGDQESTSALVSSEPDQDEQAIYSTPALVVSRSSGLDVQALESTIDIVASRSSDWYEQAVGSTTAPVVSRPSNGDKKMPAVETTMTDRDEQAIENISSGVEFQHEVPVQVWAEAISFDWETQWTDWIYSEENLTGDLDALADTILDMTVFGGLLRECTDDGDLSNVVFSEGMEEEIVQKLGLTGDPARVLCRLLSAAMSATTAAAPTHLEGDEILPTAKYVGTLRNAHSWDCRRLIHTERLDSPVAFQRNRSDPTPGFGRRRHEAYCIEQQQHHTTDNLTPTGVFGGLDDSILL